MDAKQILAFTKDRLDFLSSSHQSEKLQLKNMSGNNSDIKDFANDYDQNYEELNHSHANLLRNSAQPDGEDFNAILNDHISDFMHGENEKAGDLFTSKKQNHDGFLQIMQGFLNDDKNLM